LERVAGAFPNLEIIELVGRGGMGFVYKARQPHLDRFVALKLLPEKLAKDPQFAERFNREGRVLAKLSHPSIVSVFDFGCSGGFYFLLMEYVDGVNLRQAMQAGRFSPQEALGVVPHICEALQYAHEQGVLHRDIKPENILLDARGRVKIADFGIAKLVGEASGAGVTLTNTGSALGTLHYMAPEQLEQPGGVDHRADIYSLGVVLYEMLTGELPIGRFEPPSSRTPVTKGVDEVVLRALDRNRERRQKSAGEFKSQVETVAAGASEEVPPVLPGETSNCWPAILGAVLVGFGVLGFLAGGAVLAANGMGLSIAGLLVLGLPFLLISVVGTVLGWVGLGQIRHAGGAKRGLPLALFAAVTLPFGIPMILTIGVPLVLIFEASGRAGFIARVIVFLLISSILSGLVWGIVAIARWGANRPGGRYWSMRGWAVTFGVLVTGLTLASMLLGQGAGRGVGRGMRPLPVEEVMSAGDRLPAGAVELLAVARHPSGGLWWKPDGGAWEGEVFENPGHTVVPNAEQRAVEMVFRLGGIDSADAQVEVELEGSSGSSGGNQVQTREGSVPGTYFVAALFPREKAMTRVRVGVADGEWQTLVEEAASGQGSVSLVRDGRPVHVEFLGVVENQDGDTVLSVAHDIVARQVRLVAVDEGGREIPCLLSRQTRTHLTGTFVQLKPQGIQGFRLQVRRYRWATFSDVALEPRLGDESTTALTMPSVRIDFQNVNLVEEEGHDRLELVFKREERGAELSWRSEGRFDGAPVDFNDITVVDASSGEAVITHTVSLLVPDDMTREQKLRVVRQVRERWQGNSLVVQPGDEHDIMTVRQSESNVVVLVLVGRSRDEVLQ
jgi:tRNA A-37 threonylcarbamoyl transferase component Bud32